MNRPKKLRVAMIAPPWLALPIKGYGGIEIVLQSLVTFLQTQDIEVVIYGNGQRTLKGVETRYLYDVEQYGHMHKPIFEAASVGIAHMQFALKDIESDGHFDVVHNHNEFIGLSMLAWASRLRSFPPVVHTIHGPPFSTEKTMTQGIPSNIPYWEQLGRDLGKVYLVGISDSLMKPAPLVLEPHTLETVHNAVDVDQFPLITQKKSYFFTLARFSRDKAQHVAAKLCAEKKYHLRMAGTVAGIDTNPKLLLELANPQSQYRSDADFRYYSDRVLPYVLGYPNITYSGNLEGEQKLQLISEGRALLFPIDWDEPFGMAVIESLACGTPVIAMRRGAMPEIIEHGVNGFLADTEAEFAGYMDRVDEIDPIACRESVKRKFSADSMAGKYAARYLEAIERSKQS